MSAPSEQFLCYSVCCNVVAGLPIIANLESQPTEHTATYATATLDSDTCATFTATDLSACPWCSDGMDCCSANGAATASIGAQMISLDPGLVLVVVTHGTSSGNGQHSAELHKALEW